MGGITIALDLHPLAVMTHFLLGLAALGLAADCGARGMEPARRPRTGGRASLAPPVRDVRRAPRLRRARRHGCGRHRIGSTSGLERRGRAPRPRDRRHGVRARPRSCCLRHRRAPRRLAAVADSRRVSRSRSRLVGASASFSSARRSSARCSTATRSRGGSSSSMSLLAAAIWAFSLALAFTLWRPPAPLARK